MRSLRSRLLIGTAVGTVLVLSASGFVLYLLVRASLFAEFDGLLGAKARALSALVEQEGRKFELEFDDRGMDEFERAERPEYFQLWLTDGDVLARSRSLKGQDLERIGGIASDPACRPITLPDGRRGRIAGISFYPYQEEDETDAEPRRVILVVARETAEIDGALARLRALLVAVCAAATLLSLGVLGWVVRHGLRPVDRLADQIEGVGEEDLSARVDLAGAPKELAPIADRLNDLLTRLQAAFARERSFSADVAHELRTPLAGLRSTLEVALSRQRESEDYREAMADCLAICEQTQRMVDTLLSLARIEAGRVDVSRESVRLDEALQECWKPLAERARTRNLQVEWDVKRGLSLDSDPEKLRLILLNILENAVTHSDTAGSIHIEAGSRNGHVEVCVTNTGSQLPQGQAEHVFERFWRGDAARGATGLHCGLGLSLCKQLVTLLGGLISVTSDAGGVFRVALVFDAATGRTACDSLGA